MEKHSLGWFIIAMASTVSMVGCSDGRSTEAPSEGASTNPITTAIQVPTSAPPSPEEAARAAALEAYNNYWATSNAASKAPGSRDWRPELAKYSADPALVQRVESLRNFASVPAHFEGEPERSPRIVQVSLGQPARVSVTDCISVGRWKLVSDKPGEQGKSLDHPQQPQRYVFDAQVVQYPAPVRWLVQIVEPKVSQPC